VARKPTKKPTKSKRQRFTPEYKLEAVRLSEDPPCQYELVPAA
jgi:transposase-like protein